MRLGSALALATVSWRRFEYSKINMVCKWKERLVDRSHPSARVSEARAVNGMRGTSEGRPSPCA